MILVSGNKNHF